MLNWTASGFFLLVCWFFPWTEHPVSLTALPQNQSVSACNLFVDAGPDTNVCDPGGLLTLMGSITPTSIFYQWSPSSGLSNPYILNPTANITGPITYTLTAYGVDPNNPNLVVNGNFSGGNTGFSSDYAYVVDIPNVQNEMFPEGTYTVINNPNLVHTGFSACNDHTGGNGNMMVINGAASLQDIWCQTVPISPNTYYNVSAWVASVNPSSPAILQFSINGTPIGPIINALSTPCSWIPFNATWNSGSTTSAEICILNLNTAAGGNDFAIDDISMVQLCIVEDEVDITLYEEEAPEPVIEGPAFLCEGETGIYTAQFPADPPIYSYEWSVPSGATILSGQGTPEITILWNNEQESDICLAIETRCDMNEGCFEVTVGTLPEFPLISAPSSLCPGETATLYTPEFDPNDTYEWIVPSEVTIISGVGTNEIEVEWANEGEAEICVEVTNACGTTDNCTLLTLLPSYLVLFDTTICEGSTFVLNGTTYGNGILTGTEYFVTAYGCDSIVEVDVTEATSLEFLVTEYICPGDSVFLQGSYQTQSGTYTDSFTTVNNCDSLVITELIVSPFDTTWITLSTCDPAQAGTTIQTFSQGNCDSTVITEVLLSPTDTNYIFQFSCLPADTGQVTQLYTNSFGCDSLVLTITYLFDSDTTQIFGTTCDPAMAGVTRDTLTNLNGCDSLVITTINYQQSDTTLIATTSCFYPDTGTTSTLLINSQGCDSLVIEHVVYGGSDTTFLFFNSCSAIDSGFQFTTFSNQFGCDSVIAAYTLLLSSDTTYLSATSCEPLDTGITMQHFINSVGCDSLVVTSVTLDPLDLCDVQATYAIQQPLCYGDSAWIVLDIEVGLGPFHLDWIHQDTLGSFDYPSIGTYSFPLDIGGRILLKLTSANGLEILDTIYLDELIPLTIETISSFDFNGFGIRCNGEKLGGAEANILSQGTPPLSYLWSEGSQTDAISNLSAGQYSVTVTDNNGCKDSDIVTISEPPPIEYQITLDDINCAGQQNGALLLTSVQGGVSPVTTSLDGQAFQQKYTYTGLGAGNHEVIIMDQNGCSFEETFFLTEPEAWSIDLGQDTSLSYGSTFNLISTINGQPKGMVETNWSDGDCANCLVRTIEVVSSTYYEVFANDENGCTAQDRMNIDVFLNRDIFIPNIFSPNDDQVNDVFLISSSKGLKEIEELTIFDRWGNLVFQEFHFQPDDPVLSWDGKMSGKPLNPGVYAYKVIVVFRDDRREIKFGDVTLIR
ncbi:MAG: gliding motility-associated C-terminal domain-containing protein [Saprospiraceae bacterium]|nr:gliding motility-associated C-terminal domain-containing protein [Saprospiraceae bacterium]